MSIYGAHEKELRSISAAPRPGDRLLQTAMHLREAQIARRALGGLEAFFKARDEFDTQLRETFQAIPGVTHLTPRAENLNDLMKTHVSRLPDAELGKLFRLLGTVEKVLTVAGEVFPDNASERVQIDEFLAHYVKPFQTALVNVVMAKFRAFEESVSKWILEDPTLLLREAEEMKRLLAVFDLQGENNRDDSFHSMVYNEFRHEADVILPWLTAQIQACVTLPNLTRIQPGEENLQKRMKNYISSLSTKKVGETFRSLEDAQRTLQIAITKESPVRTQIQDFCRNYLEPFREAFVSFLPETIWKLQSLLSVPVGSNLKDPGELIGTIDQLTVPIEQAQKLTKAALNDLKEWERQPNLTDQHKRLIQQIREDHVEPFVAGLHRANSLAHDESS